jgi:pimeloyl-ACP methyl ester carboxylesterase
MTMRITPFLVMALATADVSAQQGPTTGRAPVNGVSIYYEVHGEGPPLVLLHGGVTPSETFGAPLAAMAKTHKVIAIHLRGHGFSTDGAEPWSNELMADDVAAVLQRLGIGRARMMGYSLGAAVSLQVAIRHPTLVEKLVIVSVAFRTDGTYPEVRELFAQMPGLAATIGQQISTSPLAALYPGINWETMMRKTGEMNLPNHDWTEGITTLTAPTLLVFADADYVRPEHIVEFWKLLGGGQRDAGFDGSQRPVSQLAVIPNTTHYSLIQSPLLIEVATAFPTQ